MTGDGKTAGKVVSGAASKRDPVVKEKRWSRVLDSKLLAVVAGKKKVTAGHWTEAASATGRTVSHPHRIPTQSSPDPRVILT